MIAAFISSSCPTPATGESREHHFKLNPAVSGLGDREAPERSEDFPPDVVKMLEIVADLDEKEDYRGIIRLLEAEPDDERHPALTFELARACNNAAEFGGSELLRAIRLLESVRDRYENTHKWQFRMGYALFYLEREEEALPCFERAEALQKGDQDSLEFMRLCRFQMAFPRFAKPLRERINDFWDGMAQKTPGLLKRLADPDECQDAQLEITEDLQKVVPGALAYVGAIAGPVDLNLSADGDWLRIYLLRALIRRMPEELRSDWRLTLGRRRGSIRCGSTSTAGSSMPVTSISGRKSRRKGVQTRLIAYHEAFSKLSRSRVCRSLSCVQALLDNAVGEAVRMKYYYDLRLTRKPESGVGFSVQEFQSYLRETDPMKLVTTMDDYLDESNEFDWDGSEEKDCDYLLDAVHAELSCPALVLAYFKNDPDLMRMLAQSGATAGTPFT